MRHARDLVSQDDIPWVVAVDDLEGTTRGTYGWMANPAYLIGHIGHSGHVAFRALCTGQEGLLRDKLREIISREARGENPVALGQKKNIVFPYIREFIEVDYALGRAGKKAMVDFHRAVGNGMYVLDRFLSKARPIMHQRKQR
jgi:hypothetical protein